MTTRTKGGILKLNKSYNFTDKDQIIDELFTAAQNHNFNIAYMAEKSGVARSTLRKWRNGKTERPQAPTLSMVGRRCFGWKLGWIK